MATGTLEKCALHGWLPISTVPGRGLVSEWCADVNIVNRVSHGSGGVMLWAGINYGQWTQLQFNDGNLNAQRYRDEVLRLIVVPFIRHHHLMSQLFPGLHTHQTCHPLSMFGLPWIAVYDSVFQFPPISSNFAQPLKRSGTTGHNQQLINSMGRRCVTLHKANGAHTRYWLVFWSTAVPFFKVS
jgi:hypothetical protein